MVTATDGEDVIQYMVEAETAGEVLVKIVAMGDELGVTRFLNLKQVK